MKKLKTPTAVTTAVLTLITIFFWAGFEIYRAITAKPIPVVPAAVINPLDPTIDTKTLDNISQRLFFNENQINNTQTSNQTPTPTATATTAVFLTPGPTTTASSSATTNPTVSPSATP